MSSVFFSFFVFHALHQQRETTGPLLQLDYVWHINVQVVHFNSVYCGSDQVT